MGNKLSLKAIIDSATDMNAVEGEDCVNCAGLKYDISSNVDAGSAQISDLQDTWSYGVAKLTGREAVEKFCFQLGKCVEIDFLDIDNHNAMDKEIDAIVGFARPN